MSNNYSLNDVLKVIQYVFLIYFSGTRIKNESKKGKENTPSKSSSRGFNFIKNYIFVCIIMILKFIKYALNNTEYLNRWLKSIFKIGMKRSIDDDDIYAVTNNLRSDRNTEIFAKLWEIEQSAENPSIFRVMMKIQGFNVLSVAILFSVGELMAKLVRRFYI